MVFNRNDIKISFDRPKYVTENKKVKCILPYHINVPSFVHDEDRFPTKGYNPAAVYICGEFYLGGELTATGVATCGPEDSFDKKTGREIAEARAEAKAYKHAEKLLKRYVKTVVDAYSNMLLAFEAKADCVQRHNAEYTAEVGK